MDSYSIMLTYHYAMDYPLETYLEIILMVLQGIVIRLVYHSKFLTQYMLIRNNNIAVDR